MEKWFKLAVLAMILVITPVFMFAQTPPHPNNGSSPDSTTNTPVGAGAPIADGQFVLLALVMAYTGRKIYLMPTGKIKYKSLGFMK